MIIDDLKDNRDIVKRHLKDYNFNFSEANNGQDAIEKLSKKPVDGIILDLMMPVMDGFEFLTRVKEYNQLKDINPEIKLTIYDGIDHNSWDITYDNDNIYDWLLSNSK